MEMDNQILHLNGVINYNLKKKNRNEANQTSGGGGGVSLPLEVVPDAREKNGGKGYSNKGWARNTRIGKRVSKSWTLGEKGIQIAMIKILAMPSYAERIGNLRQHVHCRS